MIRSANPSLKYILAVQHILILSVWYQYGDGRFSRTPIPSPGVFMIRANTPPSTSKMSLYMISSLSLLATST
jgi:hypothetical protein